MRLWRLVWTQAALLAPPTIRCGVNFQGREGQIGMQLPPALTSLDTRPGLQWTAEEVQELKRWWLARSQLQRVWHYAARYLGTGATREDVEEAVGDFYLLLETARQSYRPGGPDFNGYLV